MMFIKRFHCFIVAVSSYYIVHVVINLRKRMTVELAVVERILEKHSTVALKLCEQRLDVSALYPRPDSKPLLSHELDDRSLLFDNLPGSVNTDSFKKYLRRASQSQGTGAEVGMQSTVTSVIYGMHHGTALAVFEQPYGK